MYKPNSRPAAHTRAAPTRCPSPPGGIVIRARAGPARFRMSGGAGESCALHEMGVRSGGESAHASHASPRVTHSHLPARVGAITRVSSRGLFPSTAAVR